MTSLAMNSLENLEQDGIDRETEHKLNALASDDKILAQKVPGVRTILVVLSSAGVVLDVESLRQRILLTYPGAVVFFETTSGKPLGVSCPHSVDLVIDLIGPNQRAGWFRARKLRRLGRTVVGRDVGWMRKRLYDRVYFESATTQDWQAAERQAQSRVLQLVGIMSVARGTPTEDQSRTLAWELPSMRQ